MEHQEGSLIIIAREDGGVSEMNLSLPFLLLNGSKAEDEGYRKAVEAEIAKWESITGKKCKSWYVGHPDNLPKDQTFRNAWHHEGDGKVGVHMDRARALHKDRLRDLRTPLMQDLDVKYMRADEQGEMDKKKQIARQKQALRDLPDLSKAKTPEELASVGLSTTVTGG